jgi:hypothetical protein
MVAQTGGILYLTAACSGTHAPSSSAAPGAQGGHAVETPAISPQPMHIWVLNKQQNSHVISRLTIFFKLLKSLNSLLKH